MLDAILKLSACERISRLDQVFFRICSDMFGENHFLLYKSTNKNSSVFTRIENKLAKDFAHPLSMAELTGLLALDEDREKNAFWFTTSYQNHTDSILIVFNIYDDEEQKEEIKKLIQVFSNLQRLLNRAQIDALTGLNNRRMFDSLLPRIIADNNKSIERRNSQLIESTSCLMLFDIDHFKQVNDNFGHLYGDEVLLILSQIMQGSFRADDLLFRYGGEEFIIFLKNIPKEVVIQSAERFREKVSRFSFPQVGNVTISIGISFVAPNKSLGLLTSEADKAMYYAKGNGRNQIQIYQDLVENKKIELPDTENSIELF
jgi:diguanylate cyclase (GGDEF)-like protein